MSKAQKKSTKLTQKVYKYMAVFEPDEKFGGFTVTIPALPGCISEGNSFEEALNNIKEAASLYLEDMESKRVPSPETNVVIAPVEIIV